LVTKIGLLSGTFDPIHQGHTSLAQEALRQLQLDEIWLLVNAYPEHKTAGAPFEQRLAMAALAAADTPGVTADREPVQRTPQRHSVALVRGLQRDYPDHHFILVMGVDVFGGLDHWAEVAELVRLVTFGVALRHGADPTLINQLEQRLGPAAANLTYRRIIMPPVPASSTTVKQRLRAEQPTPEVHPAVQDHIRHYRLYDTGSTAT
jgi:nicotinate-nucleotide adenylyltransferase